MMDAIPLFLNDDSYPLNGDDREVGDGILLLLRTLRRIKDLDRPFVVGMASQFSEIPISAAYQTLAAFPVVDREWWRFIKALDQKVPFDSVPQCLPPDDGLHVEVDDGFGGVALLWALKNASFVLSFPASDDLRNQLVWVSVCSCSDGLHDSKEIQCRNISSPGHVDTWREALLDFSYTEAASSTIYECQSYRLKMYLNDHDPPHVHVYQSGDLRNCVGRVRFDHVEVMEDAGFSGAVRRSVLELLSENRDDFMRSWQRCRDGSLPIRIEIKGKVAN